MIWEAREDVGDPGARVDVVELYRVDEGVDRRCALAAGI